MMAGIRFLVDVNLPYLFSLWSSEEYIHQIDIDPTHSDASIWQHARANELTIITKDKDFGSRMLYTLPPPRVILIRIGNARIKALFESLASRWEEILETSEDHKLVQVFSDHIEAIR